MRATNQHSFPPTAKFPQAFTDQPLPLRKVDRKASNAAGPLQKIKAMVKKRFKDASARGHDIARSADFPMNTPVLTDPNGLSTRPNQCLT
jgi:hypothetical protein